MNSRISKIAKLLVISGASAVAFPLGKFLAGLNHDASTATGESGLWLTFVFAHLATYIVMPRGLRPTGLGRLSSQGAGAILWAAGGACLWIALLFYTVRGEFGDVNLSLLLFAEAALLLVALPGLIVIAALQLAPNVVAYGLGPAAAISILSSSLLVAAAPSAGLGSASVISAGILLAANFTVYYGLVLQRRLELIKYITTRGLAWIFTAHGVWLVALFLAEQAPPPRWLPVLSTTVQWLIAIAVPIGVRLIIKTRNGSLFRDLHRLADPSSEVRITLGTGSGQGQRTAWIISYAQASNHPRVIRQSKALLDDGWRVVVCSYDGHSPRPVDWTFVRFADSDPYSERYRLLLNTLNERAREICARGPHWASRLAAHVRQETILNWRFNCYSMLKVLCENPDLKPDLVISHDYFTANAGYKVARAANAKFAIDCQEYAPLQYSYDPDWMYWERPYVKEIQDYYVRRASLVFTVCGGIADLLNREHKLKQPVVIVRNVPIKDVQPFRPVGERIKVLYHGGIWAVRGLSETVESMKYWRPEFDLILRGDGDAKYISELRNQARSLGLENRVSIEPPVAFDDIVSTANRADVGFFSYSDYSPQIKFALPNKFFEYMMAGLCICVSDLDEVAKICDAFKVGRLIRQHSPESIAETINSFTREDIDRFKRASLVAAGALNWDVEQSLFVEACNGLFAVDA